MKPNVHRECEAQKARRTTMKRRIRLLRLRPRELSNSCLSDDKSHLGLIPSNETFLFLLKPLGPVPRVPGCFDASEIIGK